MGISIGKRANLYRTPVPLLDRFISLRFRPSGPPRQPFSTLFKNGGTHLPPVPSALPKREAGGRGPPRRDGWVSDAQFAWVYLNGSGSVPL